MTFTQEQLINQAREEVTFWHERDELIPSQQTAIRLRLAEITLAALEAPHVGYIDAEYVDLLKSGSVESCSVYAEPGEGFIAVYTAPTAPGVDADLLHIAAVAIEDLLTNKDRTGEGVWYDVPERLRRAALLQGAEPVQEWIPCSERMPERDYVLAADFSGAYYLPSLPDTQVGIYADWFEDGKPSWDDGDGNDLHLKQATHWMPLPAAPQQEANNG